MALTTPDLMLLDKAEPGKKVTGLVPGGSYDRLVEAGLIDADHKLTGKGAKFLGSLRAAVVELQRGVPFARRKAVDGAKGAAPRSTPIGWFTGTYAKKQWIANGACFILGKPDKSMEAQEGDSEVRHKVATILQSGTAGKPEDFVEMKPYAYQVADLGGMEMVWLISDDGAIAAPMQAIFFDLIKEKFPTATFYVHRDRFGSGTMDNQMFVARVTNRGLKNNIVALVMAVAGCPRPVHLEEKASGEMSGG